MKKMPRDLRRVVHDDRLVINPAFRRKLKIEILRIQEGSAIMAKTNKKSANKLSFLKTLNTVPGVAALAVLIVVGSVTGVLASNHARKVSERSSALPSNLEGLVSMESVRATALAENPTAQITGIELENEEGVLYYKVRFADGSFKLYDAKTGQLVVKPIDETAEKDESVPADFKPAVTLDQARTTAQAKRPGQTVVKIELEVEDGVVVYSVRFADGSRVDVNATDGSVVRVKTADSTTKTESSSDDSNNEIETEDEKSGSDSGSSDQRSGDDSHSGSSGSGSSDSGGSGSGHDD